MNWHNVEKRKISWRELWAMDANHIKFIGATYDVLPTPQNLSQWVGEDGSCKLCMGVGSLKHILSGCKTSLTPGSLHGDSVMVINHWHVCLRIN